MSNHFLQLVDLEQFHSYSDGTLTRNHNVVDRREFMYFASPIDMPCYVRFHRVLEKVPMSAGATGETNDTVARTMEIDAYTYGVKVYLRLGKDGTLKVIVEDSEGRETLASYEREQS